jgi:hypothetical protein
MPSAATANAAERAQSILDGASTVLRLSWRHCTTTVSHGVLSRFFA